MKNFKKVISSVIALAISASSFAAVSASKFSDVADTAPYAEAVEVLTALGIVSGYNEDGVVTFKPEGNITRAEAATMIVGALNMTEDAKNASATCQFADVNEKASWAAGYVNVGVSEGFISGRDANTFDPQSNVTYAEMCVMTTKLTGYADYATSNIKEGDPWYKCYTDMAASAGLNKGVSVPLTSALTRGNVAQMIYNALVTPKLGIVEYSFTDNKYAPLDGSTSSGGKVEFKTLLSEKFDGYVVTAEILGTPKSGTKNGEALLSVTKADQWRDVQIKTNSAPITEPGVKLVGIDKIDNQLFQSGTAVLLVNDLDEAEMVYFKANSKMETKEVSADDYIMQADRGVDAFVSALTGAQPRNTGIKFGTATPIKVTANPQLYVNGAIYANEARYTAPTYDAQGNLLTQGSTTYLNPLTDAMLDKFLGNAQGNITFVKTNRTANEFDKIFVDYYEVGKVTSVMYKSDKTTVRFNVENDAVNPIGVGLGSSCVIEINDESVEEGDVDVYVEKNGSEIELKELAKDDVIAVAMDFAAVYTAQNTNTVEDPKYIKVLATDETTKGMVLDYDDDYRTYTIGEETYKYVGYNAANRALAVATTYDLMLDPFGRIIGDFEAVSTGAKFAIIERTSSSGEEKATLLLEDGTTASYEIGKRGNLNSKAAVDAFLYPNGASNAKAAPQDRVVTYKVASDNTVTLNTLAANSRTDLVNKEYNPNTSKLGSVTITDEVKMINAKDYISRINEYAKFDASELKSQVPYTAYAYKTGDVYSFVVVTVVGHTFSEDSRFAVVTKDPSSKIYDGSTCMGAEVLYKGELVTLYWDTTAAPTHSDNTTPVSEGDVMYFTTDPEGYVSDSYKIYDRQTNVFANTIPASEIDHTDWRNGFADGTEDIQLVSGVIAEVKNNSITFGVIEGADTDADGNDDEFTIDGNTYDDPSGAKGMYTFGIAADCNAYMYDGADTSSRLDYKKYSAVDDASSIVESNLVEKLDANQQAVDYVYDVATSSIHNAVAMVVDGDVVAIFVSYPAI